MNPIRARFAANAACVVLCSAALFSPQGAWAQQDPPPAAAAPAEITPDQSAAALKGAHEALLGFAGSKSLPDAVGHLTDRSVGTIGIVFTIPVAFGIGFSELGVSPDKPSPDPNLKKDFDAFIATYLGEAKPDQPLTGLPETLKGHEREFVGKLMEFLTRVDKLSTSDSKDDGFKFSQPIPTDMSKYTFQVVSPTEVKITPTKGNSLDLPGVVSIAAVQEAGQWRLDLGDPAVILKSMQDSSKSSLGSSSETKKDPLADKMIDAVKAHDIPKMKRLLQQNPKLVDAQDFMGESALYNTVFWEDLPTAKFLIAHGAKVNAPNHFGKTPLDEAIFFKRKDMIALLKKHGAKVGPKKKGDSQ
jgi:hypothetical protein